MKKTYALPITIAIAGVAWIFAVVAYTMFFELPWMCWGGIMCTVIAICAAEGYLLGFRKDSGEQGTESGALGIIFTVVYLLIAVLLNSVFILLNYGDFNWLLLTVNVLAIAGYLIILMWGEQASGRLEQQIKKTEQKTKPTVNIGRKLGELLAITEDVEIRGRLLKLKEMVDYGTNISTDATAEKDMQMEDVLDEIAQMMLARADRLVIFNKVETAEMIWKMRNSIAVSAR